TARPPLGRGPDARARRDGARRAGSGVPRGQGAALHDVVRAPGLGARDRPRRTLQGGRVNADVVVVGSGAGGAVVAAELAAAGRPGLVREEGPLVPPERSQRFRPTESIRHLFRDGGTSFALGLGDTPMINVTMGRCVGGSSVLTGGVCLRPPESVLDGWVR